MLCFPCMHARKHTHRRDSFITHRAFCDALAEENKQPPPPPATTTTPTLNPTSELAPPLDIKHQHHIHPLPSKSLTMFPGAGIPTATATTVAATLSSTSSPSLFSLPSPALHLTSPPLPPPPLPPSSSGAHMSATALLQKAAEMGATASNNNNNTNNNNNKRSQMVYHDVGLRSEGSMNQQVQQFFDRSQNSGLTVDFLGVGRATPMGVLDHAHHSNSSNPFLHHHNQLVNDQFHYNHHHESGMNMMHQFQQQEQQQVHGVIDKPMWGDVL